MHLNFFRHVTPTDFRVKFTQQTSGMPGGPAASRANPHQYTGSTFAVSPASKRFAG
jgi:hypothetical protein